MYVQQVLRTALVREGGFIAAADSAEQSTSQSLHLQAHRRSPAGAVLSGENM